MSGTSTHTTIKTGIKKKIRSNYTFSLNTKKKTDTEYSPRTRGVSHVLGEQSLTVFFSAIENITAVYLPSTRLPGYDGYSRCEGSCVIRYVLSWSVSDDHLYVYMGRKITRAWVRDKIENKYTHARVCARVV